MIVARGDAMHVVAAERPLVLHVLEAVGGGTAKHLVDLVRHVDGVRHVAAVPSHRVGGLSDDDIVARLRASGAQVHVVPMQRTPVARRNALAVLRLRRLIRALRPDVVHAHASIGGAIARMAVAGAQARLVWTPHAINTGRLYAWAERFLFRSATVVALSESERQLIRALRVAETGQVRVIPNGVQPRPPAARLDLRARFGIAPDAPIVGTVGRLVRQKAPLEFARACARVAEHRPDARFVYIGEGPLAGALDAEVERLGLRGRFDRLRLPSGASTVVGQFDAFLLCSWYEGAPYTPLEAMVAGVPVVLTDCVGSRDAVVHGHSGLVVAPGDVEGLAAAVLRLLGDEALRSRLCREARARVESRFGIADMAQRYGLLYRQMAGAAVPAVRVPEVVAGYRPVTMLAPERLGAGAAEDPLELQA